MRSAFELCLALVFTSVVFAVEPLPRGQLIEKVTATADPSQTYALYLPSTYTADREWPVLYGFDPAARGRIPVERFKDAAEKYGWIVAGSNNSRNGSFEGSLAAVDAMWSDTHARFRLHPKRAYATGFSGGARVSTLVAQNAGLIAGVIAVGAGFPSSKLPKQIPFILFGSAGYEDFNYLELKRLRRDLDAMKVPNRFVFFPGAHEWLPSSVATEAIEWMEYHAARSGLRDPSPELELKFSGPPARETKQERRFEEREQRMLNSLLDMSAAGDQRAADFRTEVAVIRKVADAAQDTEDRRIARRVLAAVFMNGLEGARGLNAKGEHRGAIKAAEQALMIRPDNAAAQREIDRAREALSKR